MKLPIAWTIAGSDSGGGAGIQTDLHAFQRLGVHGCSVVTAVTAQNSLSVEAVHYVPVNGIISQIKALAQDLPAKAIKIGMLGCSDSVNAIQKHSRYFFGKIVLDPVLISTSGNKLFKQELKDYVSSLIKFFPSVDLLTPNRIEAEIISKKKINSYDDVETVARDILSLGVKSVLIKGGHFDNDEYSQDYWTNGVDSFWLSTKRNVSISYHGSGCTLSAAITACLAKGYDIKDAIVIGKMYVTQGMRLAHHSGAGSKTLAHIGWPEQEVDLPYLLSHPLHHDLKSFPSCGATPLGLYPIVDQVMWLEKLLSLGVTTIQLRMKDKIGIELENAIQQSVAIAKQFQARLFINDYWELAIRYGAYGVHLGQDDIQHADIEAIHKAGLRLGMSTHCYYEVARAHAIKPSYIACGPVYSTTSKEMPFLPQGISQLKRWRRTLNYPLVAIGGINQERLPQVLSTNVEGIAMISAITQANDPLGTTKNFLLQINEYQSIFKRKMDISSDDAMLSDLVLHTVS